MQRANSSWWTRFGRWTRFHLIRALRENASPARTAFGLGLGAFIGIFPSFLIGTPLSFYLAGKLGLNRAAAVAGAMVSMNPLTAPFLYSLSAWLGLEILGREVDAQAQGMLSYLRHYTGPFLLGNTLVAASIALILTAVMFLAIRRLGRAGVRSLLARPRRYRPVTPSRPETGSSAGAGVVKP